MSVELKCAICGNSFFVIPYRAKKDAKYCNYRCHQIGEGRKGGVIAAERMRAKSKGKAYMKLHQRHMHRVLMEGILGRPLASGEIVHHKDGNKLNNSLDNLVLFPSQAEHAREHMRQRWASK